jgi:hypothetical protein
MVGEIMYKTQCEKILEEIEEEDRRHVIEMQKKTKYRIDYYMHIRQKEEKLYDRWEDAHKVMEVMEREEPNNIFLITPVKET